MTQNNASAKVAVIRLYYNSGALYWEVPRVNGTKHGIATYYYESGALRRESQYENGKRHGIDKFYYASGALWWEIPYVDGNKHGIEKNYEADKSNIVRLALYDKGRKVASVKVGIKEIAHDTK